ncbi:MAG: replication factor C large subunit [Nanoarchaeota archaeon]|nr:MAG: replication factor C large subunit [Nanoarchaeota archaeon]
MQLPWSIKYQPSKLSEIVGNEPIKNQLIQYIKSYKPGQKALALEGPTGTGKTATIIALAAQSNSELVEMNASDVRNEKGITATAGMASKQMSLFHQSKIILIDEADSVSGTKDRGASSSIAELIESSSFPVILTATSLDDSKFSAIRKKVKRLKWAEPSLQEVSSILEKISKLENIELEEGAIQKLAIRTGGDIRAAIIDLQLLAPNIKKADIEAMGARLPKEAIKHILIKIFKNSDPIIALRSLEETDEDVDEELLWIDQNLPYEYDGEDLAKAYDYLSRADIFRGRIRKQQHWRYLVYVTAYMSAGVAVSKTKKNPIMHEYKRNERLLAIWMANQKNASKKALAKALVPKLHASTKELFASTLPLLKQLSRNDDKFADKLKELYKLDDEKIAYL